MAVAPSVRQETAYLEEEEKEKKGKKKVSVLHFNN